MKCPGSRLSRSWQCNNLMFLWLMTLWRSPTKCSRLSMLKIIWLWNYSKDKINFASNLARDKPARKVAQESPSADSLTRNNWIKTKNMNSPIVTILTPVNNSPTTRSKIGSRSKLKLKSYKVSEFKVIRPSITIQLNPMSITSTMMMRTTRTKISSFWRIKTNLTKMTKNRLKQRTWSKTLLKEFSTLSKKIEIKERPCSMN